MPAASGPSRATEWRWATSSATGSSASSRGRSDRPGGDAGGGTERRGARASELENLIRSWMRQHPHRPRSTLWSRVISPSICFPGCMGRSCSSRAGWWSSGRWPSRPAARSRTRRRSAPPGVRVRLVAQGRGRPVRARVLDAFAALDDDLADGHDRRRRGTRRATRSSSTHPASIAASCTAQGRERGVLGRTTSGTSCSPATGVLHFGYPPLMREMYAAAARRCASIFARVHAAGPATSLDLCEPDPRARRGTPTGRECCRSALPFVDVFAPSIDELLFILDRPATHSSNHRRPPRGGRRSHPGSPQLADACSSSAPPSSRSSSATRASTCARARTPRASARSARGRARRRRLARARGVRAVLRGERRRHDGVGRRDDRRPARRAPARRGPAAAATAATAVGACSVEALDPTSAIPPWPRVAARVAAGWPRLPVQIALGRLRTAARPRVR